MPKVQPTTTVSIDDVPFLVEKMSNECKELIALIDDWRQRDTDLVSDLLMVRGALRDMQNQLVEQIKKESEAANAKEPANDQQAE